MKLLLLLLGAATFADAAFRTCDRKLFSKVGCYQRNKNLLPDMLLTGREETKHFMPESGLISWQDYNNYIHSLACECAEKAKSLKYAFFAIGFYGECFAGKERVQIITSLTTQPLSAQCIKGDFQKCESSSGAGSHECVGSASHEYIYSIQEDTNSDDNNNVDGKYGDWSEWTQCDKECGEGVQVRERACNSPLPQGSGKDCEEIGESSETKSCLIKECPVDGGYSRWSEYSKCTASCGGGSMTKTRTCSNPPPASGGADCVGPAEESKPCGTVACPIDGKYSDWSNYNACSVTCGGGSQRRERTCNNPVPQHGGKSCEGPTEQTKSCNNQECPVDGGWTTWGAYGVCDKDCGYGTQTRTRSCAAPVPLHGGKNCVGETTSTRRCIKVECPVNGKWSAWSSYSGCSKTCTGGQKTRSRTCTNPSPRHNGQTCSGSTTQTVSCNNGVRCPFYTAYGTYTSCEGSHLRIWCTDPKQQIKLSEYWYGRQNRDTCGGAFSFLWSTSCKHSSPSKIYNTCQNRNSCTIEVNNSWLGKDPCWGSHKYIYVKFRCYG